MHCASAGIWHFKLLLLCPVGGQCLILVNVIFVFHLRTIRYPVLILFALIEAKLLR